METWGAHDRDLDMGEVLDLGRYREMLHRLRPTRLIVYGCENVDVLKGLTNLQVLYLNGCDKIPAAALRELRAALPKTNITFPDGTNNPPQ